MDSDLSGGQRYRAFEQPGPVDEILKCNLANSVNNLLPYFRINLTRTFLCRFDEGGGGL